jgi:ubiquinone/menaquinone biosynthesis C-methylase UbiE
MSKTVKLQDTGERLIAKGNEKTLTYGEHLARYKSVSGVVKNKVVLDIACGSGYGSRMIANFGASKVIAVDNSNEAVDYAKQNYAHKKVQFLVGDAMSLPIDDSSIDVVVSLETIEHLHDPKKFVDEVKRVLKKDGTFIVSTPNDDEFMDGNEFHVHEFQFNELRSLIDENFKSAKFYYQGTYFAASLQTEESFTLPNSNNLSTTKTFSQGADKAIYFLAVASDRENLDQLEENVVLADRWSTKDDIERSQSNNDRTQKLIAENNQYRAETIRLQETINNIYKSTSWQITKPIRLLASRISRTR